MRQLRTCDFCGAEPTGVYEVLPDSLNPVEAEQRRVALCPDCHDTLSGVLEPLLARLDGAEPAPPSGSTADPGAAAAPEPTPTAEHERERPAEPGGSDEGAEHPSERDAVREEVQRTAPRTDRPEGYAKLLRVLQNRDDPMPRPDLEALATNAYGLDAAAFEAVVDAALENGDLAESGSGLKTT